MLLSFFLFLFLHVLPEHSRLANSPAMPGMHPTTNSPRFARPQMPCREIRCSTRNTTLAQIVSRSKIENETKLFTNSIHLPGRSNHKCHRTSERERHFFPFFFPPFSISMLPRISSNVLAFFSSPLVGVPLPSLVAGSTPRLTGRLPPPALNGLCARAPNGLAALLPYPLPLPRPGLFMYSPSPIVGIGSLSHPRAIESRCYCRELDLLCAYGVAKSPVLEPDRCLLLTLGLRPRSPPANPGGGESGESMLSSSVLSSGISSCPAPSSFPNHLFATTQQWDRRYVASTP